MSTPIRSLSIAARVIIDMHALNNEGNESNRLMTREVGIVVTDENNKDSYGRAVVNAISGDMNKHMFADAYRDIALDLGLPLSPANQALDPARLMGDEAFRAFIEKKPSAADAIDQMLTCALTDVCGMMITGAGQSIKRKSAIEFGWTIGLPGVTEVQEFIHARHAITRVHRTRIDKDASKDEREQAKKEREENTGQMIFNRPASSGVYAFVAHLDIGAIGFNDATQVYPVSVQSVITDEVVTIARDERLRAALLALVQTILHPKGALTSTQLPHVLGVQGFVSTSSSAAAAPLISPLADHYITKAEETSHLLNRLYRTDNAVYVLPFEGGENLLSIIADIADHTTAGQYVRR